MLKESKVQTLKMKIRTNYLLLLVVGSTMAVFLIVRTLWIQNDRNVPNKYGNEYGKRVFSLFRSNDLDFAYEIKGHQKEKIYYGTNKEVSDHFNEEEMLVKYRNSSIPSLMRRFPQCICIGSLKSGTQALLEFLSLHPNIKVAPREVRYFKFADKFDMIGYETYLNKMPFSSRHQITFEKSPQYTAQYSGNDKRIPERVHSFDPSIKLLFIAKNPIDRAMSEYLHNDRAHTTKNRTFQELVMKNTGDLNEHYIPIQNSKYYHVLSVWYDYFPKNQIHVVDGDNLVKHPSQELRQIETFLDLPHKLTEDLFYFNKTKGFHCYYTREGKSKCLWPTKGNKYPALKPELRNKLQEYFYNMNNKFYRLGGRTFDWNK